MEVVDTLRAVLDPEVKVLVAQSYLESHKKSKMSSSFQPHGL